MKIALQQRAKVVIHEGIITNSDWLKSKLITFSANQNGRKYQNKLKKSDFWESSEVLIGLNCDMVSAAAMAIINLQLITEVTQLQMFYVTID